MVDEYILPTEEGPCGNTEKIFRKFSPDEIPSLIKDVKREDLSLGNWMTINTKDGYGFFYRLATKKDFRDSDGKPATLVLHYFEPFKNKGREFTPEIIQQLKEKFETCITLFTQKVVQNGESSVVSIGLEPPQYMRDELIDLLKQILARL